jgi:hypothetical protein
VPYVRLRESRFRNNCAGILAEKLGNQALERFHLLSIMFSDAVRVMIGSKGYVFPRAFKNWRPSMSGRSEVDDARPYSDQQG